MGAGVGSFTSLVPATERAWEHGKGRGAFYHPHSIYLLVLNDLGLVGLAILGWIVATTAAVLRRAVQRPPEAWERNVSLGFMAGLLAVAVHGLIDLVYYDSLIWAFIGMGGAALTLVEGSRVAAEEETPQPGLAPEVARAT
jgi:O-antigen ligase